MPSYLHTCRYTL